MKDAPIDAPRLLRAGLLEGVAVMSAGAPPPAGERDGAGDEFSRAVRSACAQLGALLSEWRPALEPPPVDVLVFDGAAAFGVGGGGREALDACLQLAWDATRAVADGALIPAGRAGRLIYIAPRANAGAHADAARAGLENLARTLSIEWARHALTTVAIAPGEHTAAEEVGALVAYLASPAGGYFSGCLLDLTGPRGATVSLPA